MGLDVRTAALGAALTALLAALLGHTSASAATPVTTPAADTRPQNQQVLAAPRPAARAAPACPSGLVALTFDDGPARGLTVRLVHILQRLEVPATFFMVGSRVRTAPHAARVVAEAGFAVGNHTWSHPELTRLSDTRIRAELRRTADVLRRDGVPPTALMRPPYGDIDSRVRAKVHALGLVPVLWDVDSEDWRGGSADQIANAILSHLRPHESNIVLQHDGVANSPASVAAVSTVVRVARHRGYCFTRLGTDGAMAKPAAATEDPTTTARVDIATPFDSLTT